MTASGAEKDVSRNEDWSSEALAAANVGLWVIEIDRNTGYMSMLANPVTMRLLGASQEMTPAESFNFWVDRVDARSKQHLWAIHDEFLADKAMHEVRYLYNHPQWGLVPVRCGGRRISDEQDDVVRIVGYHQDMTELHEAHQSLREGLVRLSLACRLGWLGVFEIARLENGELDLSGNDVFYEQFGINPAASMFRERANNLRALGEAFRPLVVPAAELSYVEKDAAKHFTDAGKAHLQALSAEFAACEPFTAEALEAALNAYVADNGLKFKEVAPPLRTALMALPPVRTRLLETFSRMFHRRRDVPYAYGASVRLRRMRRPGVHKKTPACPPACVAGYSAPVVWRTVPA